MEQDQFKLLHEEKENQRMRISLVTLFRSRKAKRENRSTTTTTPAAATAPAATTTKGLRTPITRELLDCSERLGKGPLSHVWRIDENTAVKYGDAVRMAEAAAMRLVRNKTSIPVPEVFDAYMEEGTRNGCIVMQYIDGRPLDQFWGSYNKTQKESIVAQLRRYLDELRRISGDFVDGSYCGDQFFSRDPTAYGPFESEAAFHEGGLVQALRERGQNSWTEMVVRFIGALPQHKIVLTHNVLAPRNILVRDAKVVAFVDWELSGFYPEYWEYVKAYYWPDWQSAWITEGILDKILDPFLLELGYLLHARDIIW